MLHPLAPLLNGLDILVHRILRLSQTLSNGSDLLCLLPLWLCVFDILYGGNVVRIIVSRGCATGGRG